MAHLLIVSHQPSPNTAGLTQAVVRGATHPDVGHVEVVTRKPLDAGADDVLAADGLIIGTTENFGYMAGLTKDFFERIYYPCLERTQGRPCALFIRAGQDGTGARTAIERILTGLRWRLVQEPLLLVGEYRESFADECEELGMTIAAGLAAGVF